MAVSARHNTDSGISSSSHHSAHIIKPYGRSVSTKNLDAQHDFMSFIAAIITASNPEPTALVASWCFSSAPIPPLIWFRRGIKRLFQADVGLIRLFSGAPAAIKLEGQDHV